MDTIAEIKTVSGNWKYHFCIAILVSDLMTLNIALRVAVDSAIISWYIKRLVVKVRTKCDPNQAIFG